MATIPPPLRRALLLTGGLLVGVGIAEVGVRALGRTPYANAPDPNDRALMEMREPDAVRGWRNRPGDHVDTVNGDRRVRILADGSRATGDEVRAEGERVVLIGGSFAFGHGLGDSETLAWLLQAADPERRYGNHGVSGYGTYQSLLVLESLLAEASPPAIVLYGLIEHHKTRSVGKLGWIKHLSRSASSSGVALPYCALDDDGGLVRYPPESLARWPMMRTLACVNLAQDILHGFGDRGRMGQQHAVLGALLGEMDRACRERGARLIVLLLEPRTPDPTVTTGILEESGIEFVDLRFPHPPELWVSATDHHPNVVIQKRWADALLPVLASTGPSREDAR